MHLEVFVNFMVKKFQIKCYEENSDSQQEKELMNTFLQRALG